MLSAATVTVPWAGWVTEAIWGSAVAAVVVVGEHVDRSGRSSLKVYVIDVDRLGYAGGISDIDRNRCRAGGVVPLAVTCCQVPVPVSACPMKALM